jgi:hypothetical protein
MIQKSVCLILLFSSLIVNAQKGYVGKIVDASWLHRALIGSNTNELVAEFGIKFPLEVIETNYTDSTESYLKVTKTNLDDDLGDEYLVFIGSNYANTFFFAVDNNYKILYEEHLWLHNDYPQLKIYNSNDKFNYFSFKFLHDRGTGFWLYTTKIFKIIENKVCLVAEIIDDSNETSNEKGINGRVKATTINIKDGKFYINYSFDLYPNYLVLQKLDIDDDTFSFIKKDNQQVILTYDVTKKKLVQDELVVTDTMRKYAFEPSNDVLFKEAFSKDLAEIKENGTFNQKKVCSYFLEE